MPERLCRIARICTFAAIAGAACAGADPPPVRCEYGAWSPPSPIAGLGPDTVLRHPVLAWNASTAVVVGSKGSMEPLDSTISTSGSVAVYGFGRDIWSDLVGDFAFLRPQAVLDRDAVLHLVWAEPETMPTTHFERTTAFPVSIWYSQIEPGGSWSAPRQIARRARIFWSREYSVVGLDGEGRVHVLTPVISETHGSQVIHLVEKGAEWRTSASELPSAAYVTALFDRQPPVAAYLDGSARYGRNALFYKRLTGRSADGERRPIAVSRDHLTLSFVRLLGADDGRLHLLWARGQAGWAMTEIFHVESSGNGWSSPVRVDLAAPALSIDAVTDHCGAVHLVYSVWNDRGVPVLRYRRWHNGWSQELPLPETPVAVEPALGLGPSGDPTLVWTTVSPPTESVPARRVTVYSHLSIHPRMQ